MDIERAVEFILDQQAKAAEAHRKLEEQLARSEEKHSREIGAINTMLRRAVKLAVQEARAERTRRQEADSRLAEETAQVKQSLVALQEEMRNYLRSLGRGTNGGTQKQ